MSALELHADLSRHKEKFKRLYIDEGRTLKHVMKILLQEDHCNATSNMYQKCIRQWKIGKHPTPEVMIQFLRSIQFRKAQKRRPITMRFRGQVFDEAHATNYFYRRYGYHNLDEAIRKLLGDDPSVDFDPNRTIDLSLPDDDQLQVELFNLLLQNQQRILSPFVLPKAALDGKLDRTDPSVSRILQYRIDGIELTARPREVWFNSFVSGYYLLFNGKKKTAFASVQRSFSQISAVLLHPSPGLIINILTLVHFDQPNNPSIFHELRKMMIRHMYEHSCILYGPTHMFTQWFTRLVRLCSSNELLERAMVASADFTSKILGPTDEWSIRQQVSLFGGGIGISGAGVEQINARYEKALEEVKLCSPISTSSILKTSIHIKRLYATHLRKLGRFSDCAKILSDIPWIASQDNLDDEDLRAALASFLPLVACRMEQENFGEGERLLKLAIRIVEQRFKLDDPVRLILYTTLSGLYTASGRPDDADLVDREHSSRMEAYNLPEDGQDSDTNNKGE